MRQVAMREVLSSTRSFISAFKIKKNANKA
jgi:hypothetical protein